MESKHEPKLPEPELSLTEKCAENDDVKNAFFNLMNAAKHVEKDSLNFLTALMGMHMEINNFYMNADTKCPFYSIPNLPENEIFSTDYYESYVLCKHKLFFINHRGEREDVPIKDFSQFQEDLKAILNDPEPYKKYSLNAEQTKKLIRSNGGHNPGEGLAAQDIETIFKHLIDNSNNMLTPDIHQRLSQLHEHIADFMAKAAMGGFNQDEVLKLLSSKGGPDDDEDHKEYIFFLMHNLSMDLASFRQQLDPEEKSNFLPENKEQKIKDYRILDHLTKGVHQEIQESKKSDFFKKYKDVPFQKTANQFKVYTLNLENTFHQNNLNNTISDLQSIATSMRASNQLTGFFLMEEISLDTPYDKKITYRQVLDNKIKSIFDNPVIEKSPELLSQAMKACCELVDTVGYQPTRLNTQQKNLYDTEYAKIKFLKIIKDSQSRLGGLIEKDEKQRNALNIAYNEINNSESILEVIQAARTLSDNYGMRGGIYTVSNAFSNTLGSFFGNKLPKQSKTVKDLNALIKKLENKDDKEEESRRVLKRST